MTRPSNSRKVVLSAAVAGCVLFVLATTCPLVLAQQSATPGANNPTGLSASLPASPSPADLAKQIDDLMRECDRYMNVSGQFQKVVECTQEALELSEKAGDKSRAASA